MTSQDLINFELKVCNKIISFLVSGDYYNEKLNDYNKKSVQIISIWRII